MFLNIKSDIFNDLGRFWFLIWNIFNIWSMYPILLISQFHGITVYLKVNILLYL